MYGQIFCIEEVLSNTVYMYIYASRLSDHANANLCIDGKSGVAQDIAFVHGFLTSGRGARKRSFLRLH